MVTTTTHRSHHLDHLHREHDRLRAKLDATPDKIVKWSGRLRAIDEEIASIEDAHRPRLTKAHLIFNPTAGYVAKEHVRVHDLVNRLQHVGLDTEVTIKTSAKVARRAARAAAKAGDCIVIAAGGDGTIEKVSVGMMGTSAPLGILPLGTMNNLAKALGIPSDLDEAIALIGEGRSRPIDAGKVTWGTPGKHEFYFLEAAGFGIHAVALPAGQHFEKGRLGRALTKIRRLMTYEPANLIVSCDDGEIIHAEAQMVTVSNAPYLGPQANLAPDVKMDDGLLDVVVYAGMNKLQLGAYFVAAVNLDHVEDEHTIVRKVRRLCITADRPLDGNADMTVFEPRRSWTVEVCRNALNVITGAANGACGISSPPEAVTA